MNNKEFAKELERGGYTPLMIEGIFGVMKSVRDSTIDECVSIILELTSDKHITNEILKLKDK